MENQKTMMPKMVSESSNYLTSIFTTTNYNMFGFITGNRNIDDSNLKKITNSISKKHIATNAVICALDETDVLKPLKIVDGQHRYESCIKLNIPVSYVIDETINAKELSKILNDITLMNTASKEWDVHDYLNSESLKGNDNYIRYNNIFSKYSANFEHEVLFFILNQDPTRKKNQIGFPNFKDGMLKFDVADQSYLDMRLNELSNFNIYSTLGGKRYYQKALNTLFNVKGFDKTQMLNKLQLRKEIIRKCTTVEGAIEQLSDIYNWKSQSNRVGLFKIGNKIDSIMIK